MSAQRETVAAIGALLRSQDNRATAHPIFLVQQRVRTYGFDPFWVSDIVWLDDEGEVEASLAASLEQAWQRTRSEPDGYHRTGYRDDWEYVTACFSEDAANAYISENRHNLRDPRTFAASGYRNREWIAVREFLLGLA